MEAKQASNFASQCSRTGLYSTWIVLLDTRVYRTNNTTTKPRYRLSKINYAKRSSLLGLNNTKNCEVREVVWK